MRPAFQMFPAPDLSAAVSAWRALGLEPLWIPDDETVILGVDGRAVIMIENHVVEHRLGGGPVFIVEDVVAWACRRRSVDWAIEPCDVPVGHYGALLGPDGVPVRLLDLRGADMEHRSLFTDD